MLAAQLEAWAQVIRGALLVVTGLIRYRRTLWHRGISAVGGRLYDCSVPRPNRSTRELCKASEHVAYEIEMLYGALHDLEALYRARYGGGDTSLWTHDALIESWTIHVRNMMHFLRAAKPQADDIVARDFFTAAEWHRLLPRRPRDDAEKQIDRRINKEIVHLTFARTKVTPEKKQWRLSAITAKVGDDLQIFVNNVPMNLVEPSFHRRVLDALKSLPR